jgi:hypothetical protein
VQANSMGRLVTLGAAVRLIGGRAQGPTAARSALPLMGAPRGLWPLQVSECTPGRACRTRCTPS